MEPKLNAKRKKKRTLLFFAIAAAVCFLIGAVAFSFWHSRHYTILLDPQTVEILETADSDKVVIRITGKARQWWFDLSSHTFHVQKHYSGDLPYEVLPSENITTSFVKSADFSVTVFCRKYELRYVLLGVTSADGERLNDIGYYLMRDKKLFRYKTVDALPALES